MFTLEQLARLLQVARARGLNESFRERMAEIGRSLGM